MKDVFYKVQSYFGVLERTKKEIVELYQKVVFNVELCPRGPTYNM
jgi:hypothetical protein